ncbi:trimeric intracellular cation channel family protein [Naumannella cuiyingiana]|uniref:Putative membrane protein YeiH n=1 Tax=Naumannella cuiyingiana TaxID=1347891 RepID=A0A7Z0D8R8_9ACTN|nr:trimeric intracellular cation channel family protein [Naumannella cuiyingiana]NYI71033.1 putative membrane protein YeiH [Naumannella cuiyingiana]
MELVSVFRVIDLLGVLCNAIIGGSIARTLKFDPVGFAVLAIMSALAGGMLRDILLAAGPPVALIDPAYLITALAGAAFVFVLHVEGRPWRWALAAMDAVCLGAWAATGTVKALGLGHGPLTAIMLGLITAVGGGMLRDIAIGRVPAIFGGNTLYATAALLASLAVLATPAELRPTVGMIIATVVGAAITLLARWRRWQLPQPPGLTVELTTDQVRSLVRRAQRDERRRLLRRRRPDARS